MATTVTKTIKSAGGDYSSLSAWEAAQQGNLVTADEVRVAECYGFADTSGLTIDGSTTDSTRYMRIVAASGAEAQMPWNTSTAYRLSGNSAAFGCVLDIADDYVRVERIQIDNTTDDNNLYCIRIAGANVETRIVGCFLRNAFATSFGSFSYGIDGGTDAAGNRYIVNCVVQMGLRSGASNVLAIKTTNHNSGKTYIYNTTVIGGATTGAKGIEDSFADTICKNVLCKGNLGGDFSSMTSGNMTTCASSDATATGTGARTSQTFTFVSSSDFHLASGDAGAKDFGTDLSADASFPFSNDFDGVARTGTWDIGADEVSGGGGGGATFRHFYGSKFYGAQ